MNVEKLIALGACPEAVDWAREQKNEQDAWQNCKRADWMLWLLAQTYHDADSQSLVLVACDFADTVLRYVPDGETRPAEAIAAARAWAANPSAEAAKAAWSAAEAAWAAARATWSAAEVVAEAVARSAQATWATWAATWSAARAAEAAARAARAAGAAGAAEASVEAVARVAWATWAATWSAARAAEAAARAADGAVGGEAWLAVRAANAEIIRRYFPHPPKV